MATVASPARYRSTRHTQGPSAHYNSDSSRKRQKYIPGGPGGGGRWIEQLVSSAHNGLNSRPSLPRMRSTRTPARTVRPRRELSADKPTYDSAADAAAAATVQIDGYKPREERGWEEFHPELQLESSLVIFSANEVDGIQAETREGTGMVGSPLKHAVSGEQTNTPITQALPTTPARRRPGRPPRRPESMLSGLGSPPAQKIAPLPSQNPRERLTLPKPSYREVRTFDAFEADKKAQENYVDKTMRRAGFQEGERFDKPKHLIRFDEHALQKDSHGGVRLDDITDGTAIATFVQVEYDMDEQDEQWLELYNAYRKEQEQVDAIKPAVFEVTMTLIEQEWHVLEKRIPKPNPKPPQTTRVRSSSSAAVNGEPAVAGEEQDSKCAICDDGDCENTNAIVFCDGCDLAVHQECYGVPFIPEGQWLCRKCQQVGRAIPTCVFCPNTDGAFKLTAESRWAHLLCAIWIPEVTIGNQTFMEPIMEVAAVPKQRWKLLCYICNQKMGACIQCGNKNCYQAFHVTCARRAKLFLKMKSAHGGPASLDASVLKALCDRHVPQDWAREHDVEAATSEAKHYYRTEMKGRKWADSQQSALALVASQAIPSLESIAEPSIDNGAPKRKQSQPPKSVWRLPSGAPVVPQLVAAAVDEGIARFGVRKRREFVAEVCKYWTLKREARRGAALIKRLQLQMETFSTIEITRRDFSAMGSVGRERLDRRIAFAVQLEGEMSALRALCDDIRKREEIKLMDAELLKDVVDVIYTPMSALLGPIIDKGKKLCQTPTFDKPAEGPDSARQLFYDAFESLLVKSEQRFYGSVQAFSMDLGAIFRPVSGLHHVRDALEAYNVLSTSITRDDSLTTEQKDAKKLAKRIIKALQPLLIDALRREQELIHGKPFEKELKDLESMFSAGPEQPAILHGLPVRYQKDVDYNDGVPSESSMISPPATTTADMVADNGQLPEEVMKYDGTIRDQITINDKDSPEAVASSLPQTVDQVEPLTPPRSEKELPPSLNEGGIPWYVEGFSPNGITIHDESYDGLKVRREMSEQLSEMDEEELEGLGVGSKGDDMEIVPEHAEMPVSTGKLSGKKRKRNRGFY